MVLHVTAGTFSSGLVTHALYASKPYGSGESDCGIVVCLSVFNRSPPSEDLYNSGSDWAKL